MREGMAPGLCIHFETGQLRESHKASRKPERAPMTIEATITNTPDENPKTNTQIAIVTALSEWVCLQEQRAERAEEDRVRAAEAYARGAK